MELAELLARIDAVPLSESAVITQLRHEEDNTPYQVWRIETDQANYILKEAKASEAETYQSILAFCGENSVPALYQAITFWEKTYLLLEYIQGEDLRHCNRTKLTLALNALIALQRNTWNSETFASKGYSFEQGLWSCQNRGRYLKDSLLEEVYDTFLKVYQSVPRTLCHDDLLPFNVIISEHRAVLIDWEYGGILPYPASFARLIAHGEEVEDAFFHLTQEDRAFAIDYYYEHLLREKGISYSDWRRTLEYFVLYEYCEWVFVGNKYGATDGEYYKKYLPMARQQAEQIKRLEAGLASFEIEKDDRG